MDQEELFAVIKNCGQPVAVKLFQDRLVKIAFENGTQVSFEAVYDGTYGAYLRIQSNEAPSPERGWEM